MHAGTWITLEHFKNTFQVIMIKCGNGDPWAVGSFRLGPVRLVEDVWRFTDCCEILHGPVFANVTTSPSRQYWGRFYSFKTFVAARFIAAALRITRTNGKRVYVPSSVGNLFSDSWDGHVWGRAQEIYESLLQITRLSQQSACCHGNTRTPLLFDGVKGLQRDRFRLL